MGGAPTIIIISSIIIAVRNLCRIW
jgi:hypothetical protein